MKTQGNESLFLDAACDDIDIVVRDESFDDEVFLIPSFGTELFSVFIPYCLKLAD